MSQPINSIAVKRVYEKLKPLHPILTPTLVLTMVESLLQSGLGAYGDAGYYAQIAYRVESGQTSDWPEVLARLLQAKSPTTAFNWQRIWIDYRPVFALLVGNGLAVGRLLSLELDGFHVIRVEDLRFQVKERPSEVGQTFDTIDEAVDRVYELWLEATAKQK